MVYRDHLCFFFSYVTLHFQQYLCHHLSSFNPKHQNRRLRRENEGNCPVIRIEDDHSRSLQPRMYSVSSNTKEMYQLSVPGEKAGSTNSHGLTVGSLFNISNEQAK